MMRATAAILLWGATTPSLVAQSFDPSESIRLGAGNPVELMRLELPDRFWRNRGGTFGGNVACGDIDGDGFDEIVASSVNLQVAGKTSAGAVAVFRGADRRLWRWLPHPTPVFYGFFGAGLALADFNQDGFEDLVIAPQDWTGPRAAFWVYWGPTLQRVDVVTQSTDGISSVDPTNLRTEDMDRDGYPDLVYGNPSAFKKGDNGAFFVYHGPDFQRVVTVWRPDQTTNYFGEAVATGDVDGDGWPDVVVADPYADSLRGKAWVYFGPDYKVFVTLPNPDGTVKIEYGYDVVVGDFNDDGHGDVVLGAPQAPDANGASGHGRVYVYWGPSPSAANLTRLENTPADEYGGEFGSHLRVADVDEDGMADLVVGARSAWRTDAGGKVIGAGEMNVLQGGSFERLLRLIYTHETKSITKFEVCDIGDVTGDGHVDLALGSYTANLRDGRAYVGDLSAALRPFATYAASDRVATRPGIRIHGAGVPEPGRSFQIVARDVPASGLAWLGMSPTYTAVPLVGGGRTGTGVNRWPYLLVPPPLETFLLDESGPLGTPGGMPTRQRTFAVPWSTSLLGLRMRFQAFATDVTQPGGLSVSNGLTVTIGDW